MSRSTISNANANGPRATAATDDWRERVLWTSLAVGLLALLLFGLIGLAQWGERSTVAGAGPLGVDRLPGSTALAGELLVPPAAIAAARGPASRRVPVALPAVSSSIEAGSRARFQRATRWRCKPVLGLRTRQAVQLVETNGELCEAVR